MNEKTNDLTESLGDIAVYCIIMKHMVESNKQDAKKQRRKTMNNKEASINKVDELVNRAQLAINDWQCSGDVDCLEKAAAYLRAAMMEAEGKNE